MPNDSGLSVAECRALLKGSDAGMTDEQIEQLRNGLERIASALYDDLARMAATSEGAEAMRWVSWENNATPDELREFFD